MDFLDLAKKDHAAGWSAAWVGDVGPTMNIAGEDILKLGDNKNSQKFFTVLVRGVGINR